MIPPLDQVEITEECSLHHYYTQIPNIIFEMNLDPYVFKAYCVLKMTAGDKRSCFKGTETLCKEVGCQKPKLIEIKKELVSRGLIRISKRKHENGGDMADLITIIDIWGINSKIMSQKYPSTGGGNLGLRGGVIVNDGGGNLGLPKQDVFKQDIKKQQQQPPAAAYANMKIYECLKSIDIPDHDKFEICRSYQEPIVISAIKWSLDPANPTKKCMAAKIKYACKYRLTPEQKKKTPYEILSNQFKHGEIYNNAECYLKINEVSFTRGIKHEQMKIDQFFSFEKFNKMCDSFGIKFSGG